MRHRNGMSARDHEWGTNRGTNRGTSARLSARCHSGNRHHFVCNYPWFPPTPSVFLRLAFSAVTLNTRCPRSAFVISPHPLSTCAPAPWTVARRLYSLRDTVLLSG